MKYIDADKLIAEIEKLLAKAKNDEVKAFAKKDAAGHLIAVTKTAVCVKIKKLIASLQQERPELPPIGYAETYYQKGLRDGIIKGQIEILKGLEDVENRKAEPVLVIKEQEQPEVELSEEDLQHKSWILECLADGERKMPEYAEDFRAAYKWLKFLHPCQSCKVDLEKAARHVYESWMGGTMDDVRRDMVELGTVLNARKEE